MPRLGSRARCLNSQVNDAVNSFPIGLVKCKVYDGVVLKPNCGNDCITVYIYQDLDNPMY